MEAELRLVAHPGGRPWSELPPRDGFNTLVAIGPEGGWTASEVAAAIENGWHVINLGPQTLRVETAALAVASALALGQ